MKAVQLTLDAFLPRIMGESDILMSDSTTVGAYLEKQGGTFSCDLCRLAQEVVDWSELHMVTIMAKYILEKRRF